MEVLELMRKASSRPDVTFQLVMQMAVLKFPHTLQKLTHFAALFGGMFTFWRLSRSSELVVARASGVSVWQFLAPAVVVAVSIGAGGYNGYCMWNREGGVEWSRYGRVTDSIPLQAQSRASGGSNSDCCCMQSR